MSLLELLTAALLATSALLKFRWYRRTGAGLPPGVLAEGLVALTVGLAALPRAMGLGGLPRWVVPAALALLVVSSIDHARRLVRHQRERAETEAGRLQVHVRYLSKEKEG